MMTAKVLSRDERLEVNLSFSDSRLVDIEFALLHCVEENAWHQERSDLDLDHVRYVLTDGSAFLATVHITHGLEPPTKVLIENRPPDGAFARAHLKSTAAVAEALLNECAARGLASGRAVAGVLTELERHAKAVA